MTIKLEDAIPILRIFDEPKARDFYVGFLGFAVDWEHRFHDGAPLYMQVSRDGLRLHLTEHHGDTTPGTRVFVAMHGLDDLHAELLAKDYPMKPGIHTVDWGREITVIDPFNNRLTFCEQRH
jgi:catechol 2,3-dioxygenase-like lactoylglutathione lyase family enzyme